MARFGYGHSASHRRPQTLLRGLPLQSPLAITPSPSWNGTAASGFTATPSDPPRTTAKPALRLIVLPNMFFEDEYLVGVSAWANNGGDLLNCGLDRVEFHFEGATASVSAPNVETVTDTNGIARQYFGWWVKLKKPAGVEGEAHLYVEAVPSDATMQNRVIGPYSFFPHGPFAATGTLYDYELEIAPSQSQITGQRYQNEANALNYLRNESLSKTIWNPRLTYTEGGTRNPGASWYIVDVKGWTNVVATLPITLAKDAADRDKDTTFRPKFGQFRYAGANITFDTANAVQYYTEFGHRLAMDGVNILNSRGRTALYRKGSPNMSRWARENTYFLECDIDDIHNVCAGAQLVRGGTFNGVTNDPFTDALCVIGTTMDTLDNDHLAIDVDAMTVQYTGTGAAATLELTGTSDATTRTFTAKVDGASVGTFNVQNSLSAFNAGTNYNVQNVVDWINGLTGWTATLIDDTRRATGLSTAGNRGAAFSAIDVKAAPVTLVTHFDLHSDWYAVNVGGAGENVIVADNIGWNLRAQDLFVAASSPRPKDFVFVNNALANKLDNPTGEFANADAFSQLGGSGAANHVVYAHNSLPTQGFLLRTDQGLDTDAYCLMANNAMRSITWSGAADADMVIANNVIDAVEAAPSGATGTVIAGTHASKQPNSLTGDFAPAGELLSSTIAPVVAFDALRAKRANPAPVGAVGS